MGALVSFQQAHQTLVEATKSGSRIERRDAIQKFEDALLTLPQVDQPLKHHFVNNTIQEQSGDTVCPPGAGQFGRYHLRRGKWGVLPANAHHGPEARPDRRGCGGDCIRHNPGKTPGLCRQRLEQPLLMAALRYLNSWLAVKITDGVGL